MRSSYDILISADVDEIFAVNNKEITAPKDYEDVVVKGDNRSNSLIFIAIQQIIASSQQQKTTQYNQMMLF